MLPYILLVFVPAIFCFFSIEREKHGKKLCLGNNEKIRETNIALPIFFLLLFLVLALRNETIGRDLPVYKYHFQNYAQKDFFELIKFDVQSLFYLMIGLIGKTGNFQLFLVIVGAMCVFPIAKIYCQDRRNSYLKIILFLSMSTFIILFSTLRQAIAMAIGMLAYECVKKRKKILYVICCIIALGFHHSAFILFLFYPAYYFKIRKKHLLIIVPVIAGIYVFNKPIFSLLLNILSKFTDEYGTSIQSTSALGTFLMFSLFAIFSFLIPDENIMDNEVLGLRNFLLIAIILQSFAPLHTIAMRFNFYFIIFIPILIPKILEFSKREYKQIALAAKYIMSVFFTIYFLLDIYQSYITGISALDTIPYIPFWRG